MSGVKDLLKNGWRPEKEGTTFKGQMKGLIGRGDKHEIRDTNHQARPLSSLKDPSSFGPPPRHVNAGSAITPINSSPYQPPTTTTGLDAVDLPPPPARRDGPERNIMPPPPNCPAPSIVTPGPPKLPPRPPPRSDGILNQGAMNRLGAAGISVPGLGIGKSAPGSGGSNAQPNGLKSRFSKLGLSAPSATPSGSSSAPSSGTTFAQKQAAFKTVTALHKDPSSVSLADARAAASTANDFRQRHGEQVAAGLRTANHLNEKYAVAGRVAAVTGGTSDGALAAKKKPPPPPPPKKNPGLASHSQKRSGDEPPPIPMATRPQF
ncbi:hypothetical protein P8C59_006175 [Phyllachora maydis]|uniref:Gmp synthase n=1 Tax=Phyllachora maydis TaxID=1825666 RepID=A0AAD9MF90_9PEZI|nr:hypothetical protein P8C59_006175 [Phyllachora maydis]